MATIYMSPDPYFAAFVEPIDSRKVDLFRHWTAGLKLFKRNGRLIVGGMETSTPAAQIPCWRTCIRGATLLQVGDIPVTSIRDVHRVLKISARKYPSCPLLFAFPEICQDISHNGLSIMNSGDFSQATHDQLNDRWDFLPLAPRLQRPQSYSIELSGDILKYVTRVMQLTHGKLLKQRDWQDWQDSEFLQLDQYYTQGMFGDPCAIASDEAVFNLVNYNAKVLNRRKKAHCTCEGSTYSGMVCILDKTYANFMEQTSSHLFYAIAAAENLLIYEADVSNAFAEAPPPKQGFFIQLDCDFHEWWMIHLKCPPILDGHVVPVLSAMQEHPESPRLWEKHSDAILRDLGLIPMVHEPCLYSVTVDGKRIIFKRQVDDFAIAAPNKRTSDILLDMLDDCLSIPIKHQGYLDMYNGMNVTQTHYYIKIDCHSFV
jgi:hypothetical protein